MTAPKPLHEPVVEIHPWYAIRTRSNQEKLVASGLIGKGLDPYIPSIRSNRRTDRTVMLDRPLFPGYVFCRFPVERRLPILTTPGVVSILGFGSQPAPIPDVEMEAVRRVLAFAAEPHPFLKAGQRVRVEQGFMEGVEGILIQKKSNLRLLVSIEILQRSVSVEIDSHLIRAL